MALIVNDRVRESTTVVGTGTATLLGAITGYQAFSVIGNGNTCYYTIADQIGANWEVGIGTYTSSGNTLARTKVLSSSNADALVSFTTGTKDVFITYPAETSVSGGGGGTYPTTQPSLNLDFANSKQLDPRITFVRNSTAAYYDGQTSALAEQNLLLQSNFQSGWLYLNTTSSLNTVVAPDGTTTGAVLTGTGTSGANVIYLSNTFQAGTYTYSVYAKAGTSNYMQLCFGTSDTTQYANFDLTSGAGVVGTKGAAVSASSITLVNGWYRCTMTTVFPSAQVFTFINIVSSASAPYYQTNSLTTSINIWGAQLEQRSSVTAYTPTTTVPITNYIPQLMTAPAGVARFDCDPITRNSLGLLIEESRTNLATYSSDFSNAAWVKGNATVTANTIIAPDGTLTGDTFTATTVFGTIQQTITVTASTLYTFSWYAKLSTLTPKYSVYNATTPGDIIAPSLYPAGTSVGNGWFRYSATFTTPIGCVAAIIYPLRDSGTTGGIYIWGAQLEAGAFATSYIPTVASTVTRAADAASMTGTNFSSWYNQSEWSLYWESNSTVNTVSAIVWELYGNTVIAAFGANNTNGGLARFVTYGSTTVNQIAGSIVAGSTNKYSVTTKPGSGNNVLTLNGVVQSTTASPAWLNVPTGLYLYDVNSGGTSSTLNGHIKKLSYYPVALSSSNLVALTS